MSFRNYSLDWLRVLAFFLLIVYHCLMPFQTFEWEVNNPERSGLLTGFAWWLHQWRIPLLFFVSGIGMQYSLRQRTVGAFAVERLVRLLIPLAFAVLVLIPFQLYFEWVQDGRFSGTFLQFYPDTWIDAYKDKGINAWSHMWFIAYLLVFAYLLLPAIAVFKRPAALQWKVKISDSLASPRVLPWLNLPLLVLYVLFFTDYPETRNLVNDWFIFSTSFLFVLYGYLLGGSARFWDTCRRNRNRYLAGVLVLIPLLEAVSWWNMWIPAERGLILLGYGLLASLHVWLIILAAVGFATRYLNFDTPFLRYNTEGVYPYYILHQTVIVVTAFYLAEWPAALVVKLAVLVLVTFGTIYFLFRFAIRPFTVMRVLFGLKPKRLRVVQRP